jgi:tetratricopeptide (TPR) repeat protein
VKAKSRATSWAAKLSFILLLNSGLALPPAIARPNAEASDQAERRKAEALFTQGKRLEALPLLEDLVRKDPNDNEMLVDLAAALIDHAGTLTDQDAAARERSRAKDLLQKAWELGNTSPFAENLRQLLNEMPANSAIKFSDNPAVEKTMVAGESAFYRGDFNDALKAYEKALELDPNNYFATLFTANTYDRKNDVAKAGEWYERTIQLDPDLETAFRYYADMLAREGDMSKARAMLIRAAVAEPYNKIVWREIRAWAMLNNTAFNIVYVSVPASPEGDATSGGQLSRDVSYAWRAYDSVRADWQKGGRFQKRFPQETEYRHSLPEESEALTAAAKVLEKLKEDRRGRQLVTGDPVAGLLLRLYQAGLIDPYVLFSLGDDGIAKDYIAYRAKNRVKLEAYMDKFVIPPAPARR